MQEEVLACISTAHSLAYEGLDICALHKQEKLKKQRLQNLNAIWNHFGIAPILGPGCSAERKKTFLTGISKLVVACSCSAE